MTQIDDGQAAGVIGGKADLAATGAGGVTAVPVQPTGDSSVMTVVSGTALQASATRDAFISCNITTSAALAIAIGPTSTPVTPISISQSSALGCISFFLPKGWYVKFTGTVTNYAINKTLLNT